MRQQNSARMFLGGHSYGGRQASMLCAAEPGLVEALLLLSYPLHPPQRPQQLRTGHFAQLQTAAMFVHGVRDGFGSIDELTTALKLIPARTQLLPIDAAGHELLMKHNRDEMPNQVVAAFQSFA
jgi:predicted alpha/beta-hydrolase family hydrolase